MSSTSRNSETTPLIQPATSEPQRKTSRNVTFNPNPSIISSNSATVYPDSATAARSVQQTPLSGPANPNLTQTGLSTLNSKLRRRNSYGSPLLPISASLPAPKIGPQRTSKNAQKLKLLPNPEFGDEGPDEESGRDVYSQYTRIKDPTARRDAARLGKADRDRLPRVTAYCTSNKYQMDNLLRFLKGRGKTKGANPKLFDECIYTPYHYRPLASNRVAEVQSAPVHVQERRHSDSALEVEDNTKHRREDLIDLHTEGGDTSLATSGHMSSSHIYSDMDERQVDDHHSEESHLDFDTHVHTPEIFIFDYGVVVIWGMSLQHEQRFLKEVAKFESEKLAPDDMETECFNFYYTKEYQARIYNDFITLREKTNYMSKLAISHALAQSVKTSLYEGLVANTIERCQEVPDQLAQTGKILLSRQETNMQVGELFILRISIHLNGSVLDTPELFWVEPQLEPVYQAVRSYLEIEQRVGVLTQRLDVIKDFLSALQQHLSHGHGEKLEWIVIVLIAAEIVVAGINIVVDLYAGV